MTQANGTLAGRTVLITGASGGLGERFARIAAAAAQAALGKTAIADLMRAAQR